jgi:transposase
VGSDYGTAFLLNHLPANPKGFIRSEEFAPFKVHYNIEEMSQLLDLGIDCVVLEPTGGYEDIFIHWMEQHGIKYRLSNLGRVKHYRNNLGIAKSDGTDAFSLACFGHAKWNDLSAWVKPMELSGLREDLLRRRSLTGIRRSLVPRLRQWLHKEFPEARNFVARREWSSKPMGLLLWLDGTRGKHYFARWENKHQMTCGRGVSEFTRNLGRRILEIDQELVALERSIEQVLSEERFSKYHAAFDQLGFSTAVRAWWLCRIFPFEQFLDETGRPIETKRLSREGQKPVTMHISLSRFKCALGAGTIPNTSGIRGEAKPKRYRKPKRRYGEKKEPEYFVVGDRYCRESFFMWSDRQVVTGSLKAPLAGKLRKFYLDRKEQGRPYYKIIGGLHGYACRLLFRLLLKSE